MTAFQRILTNTEWWNETVVTPSLAKPHQLICTPNTLDVKMRNKWNWTNIKLKKNKINRRKLKKEIYAVRKRTKLYELNIEEKLNGKVERNVKSHDVNTIQERGEKKDNSIWNRITDFATGPKVINPYVSLDVLKYTYIAAQRNI